MRPNPVPVASAGEKPHNRRVPTTPWQKRIRRAEQIAVEYPFAAEILGFYIPLARFQETLWQRLERGQVKSSAGEFAQLPHSPEVFSSFLTLVEQEAPVRFAEVACHLRTSSPESTADLLNRIWSAAAHPPDAPEAFLAFAFLQPYAEYLRNSALLKLDGYTYAICPFCNRKPALAVLRPLGDGARRNLVCGFCLCEWEFRRIVCAGCGQEDPAQLPVYTAEQFPHIRVECCDTCRTYIKSVDLAKNGNADPLVDELAAVPLDLWAREHTYAKLHPNLLGL